jgi:chemotaxis protein MotB
MPHAVFLLMCGLVGAFPLIGEAQEAHSVKLGEAALRFSAGSIRHAMPQDGIVNLVTGDNQTTGNRMILGWGGSDVLYLKLHRPGDAAVGDLYTVYRRVHKVFHPLTKRYMGYVFNMLAVVRVIQVDHNLATVQIVRSFAPLSPGDSVVRFVPPAVDEEATNPQGPQGQMKSEAMIVDLQSDKNMSLVGQGNLVYLDQGRGNGVRPGDRFEVERFGGGLPRRRIAEIKVLSTEDETATAVITKSTSRVLVGDRVRYQGPGSPEDLRSGAGLLPSEDHSLPAAAKAESGPSALTLPGTADKKVRILPAAEGTRISLDELVEQLEYDSGEVKIKASGLVILERVTDFLRAAASEQPIRVEGHADNMEIGPSLRSVFASNWELSRARAEGIVRYLVEQGGLDSAKLSAVGYGATRPVASNATEEGRKRNRRIEIVLLTTEASQPEQDASEAAGSKSRSLPKEVPDDQSVSIPGPMPVPVKEFVPTAGPPAHSGSVPSSDMGDDQTSHATPPMELAKPSVADVVDDPSASKPVQ